MAMQDYLKFKYTLEDVAQLFVDDVVLAICKTAAFQRLKGISFLGAVEKGPEYSKRRNNRFDHSIGVALLAQHYAKAMGFTQTDRIRVVVAGLLHDIGHAPLSHSIEPLFVERFGLNHHVATENILRGEVSLGKDLYKTLSQNQIDIDLIISLMGGEDTSQLGRVFSSPINIDTIEAIWRGGSYVRKQFFHPISVLDSFIAGDFSDGSVVDRFWAEKNSFYWLMIYSNTGIAADHWARAYVNASSRDLLPEDFYLTEKHFLQKYLSDASCINEPTEVDIKVRTFEVDVEQQVSCYDSLSKRYKVVKSRRSMLLHPPGKKPEGQLQPSIF
jgi:hypothetical protein